MRADWREEAGVSGRRNTRGEWGEQEGQRREEREGRWREGRAWWAVRVREGPPEGVTRSVSLNRVIKQGRG